uniref:BZIP domain-containing protein n=2 Tax=Cyprinus carpio TaxID=7962 RepID=A0A8C1NY67_CYPCA
MTVNDCKHFHCSQQNLDADHRHHHREKNRDAARKSRRKHTEKADLLHEVSSRLGPLTLSLSLSNEWVRFALSLFMLPLQILTFVVYLYSTGILGTHQLCSYLMTRLTHY